ncbi:hypothetical protein OpiT1DRAFT_03863 [Opitutaceae bacterium TAV1]|nr:hypothetical protein OpiT1DRAFT_03863 [Opitutaceae bacterium TAV1]
MTEADRQLLRRVADKLEVIPRMPADATDAAFARQAGHTRGFFTVKEFAAVIGNSPKYVYERIKARSVKTLKPHTRPYRIPLSEESDWNLI